MTTDFSNMEMLRGIFLQFLQGLSILFALVLLFSLIDKHLEKATNFVRDLGTVILFGSFNILTMSTPAILQQGFIIDFRSIIIFLATIFGGHLVGTTTALTALIYRIYLGGQGVTAGIIGILLILGISIGFKLYVDARKKVSMSAGDIYFAALFLHVLLLITFFGLPDHLIYSAILNIGLPIVAIFPLIAVFTARILRDSRELRRFASKLASNENDLNDAVLRLQQHYTVMNEHAIVAETDQAGRITYVNDKFCELSQYTKEELIGQNHRILKSEVHSKEFFSEFWSTISSGQIWQGQVCNKKKDGSYYWVSSTVMPLFHPEKNIITGYISLRTDITALKQMEEMLRRSQKMEAVGELTGGIAHDFNNLLGIIVGNHDLLARQLEPGSKAERLLGKAQKAALRGANFTRRLLGFSRRQSEEVVITNLNNVLGELSELIEQTLTGSIDLVTNLSPDINDVSVDISDFQDAIINLAVNARDAMAGAGRLTIETRNVTFDKPHFAFGQEIALGDYVEVVVSDNGTGLPEGIKDKIFDPFFTTKETGKGTGLGLSMVYGFVKRSSGYISVYSEKGQGTAFKIYLPRVKKADEFNLPVYGDGHGHGKGNKEHTGALTGREKILVVDDEADLLEITVEGLRKFGYDVVSAQSGSEAIDVLNKDDQIQLVFSDIVMPGEIDGFQLGAYCTAHHRPIEVILASGFTKSMQDDDKVQGWGDRLIAKPYRIEEVALKIRTHLDMEN